MGSGGDGSQCDHSSERMMKKRTQTSTDLVRMKFLFSLFSLFLSVQRRRKSFFLFFFFLSFSLFDFMMRCFQNSKRKKEYSSL